jgi:hypothetical protein
MKDAIHPYITQFNVPQWLYSGPNIMEKPIHVERDALKRYEKAYNTFIDEMNIVRALINEAWITEGGHRS